MAKALQIVAIVVALVIGIAGGYFVGAASVQPQPVGDVITQIITTTQTATVTQRETVEREVTVTTTVEKQMEMKPPRTILIGATVPKSGPFSPIAGKFDALYKAWEDLINERGGLYVKQYGMRLPVKVIIYDDNSDGATAARLYEKLITEDKVDILLGPYATPVNIPVIPVVGKYGVPLVTTQAGSPPLYDKGYDNVFSAIDLITRWSDSYFDMIAKEGKAKTIAFVVEDHAYARGLVFGAKPKAQEIGLEVVAEEVFPFGAKDFTPIIIKLKAADPDIIYVAALAPGAAAFVKQALEQGLQPREYHVPQLIKAFIETVGKDKVSYFTGEWWWTEGLTYDGYFGREVWLEAMRRAGMTNEDYPWASVTWQAIEVAAAAIEHADSLSKEDLVKALKDLHILTISGPVSFREEGKFKWIGTLKAFPVQIINGEFEVIWPPELKTADHIYPTPWT